ncbi:DUF7288 family protein [Natrinema versiforme]|uniref:Uncharacterized protein n=1 Tax=Natrinema versiforme JCM 10478 TaxID=1227496 RepID=L9Y8Q1_9EURY|nr:hypothetical protein [Natrinema versiforme]ELY70026.1 hypothetical protein C489_03726 [Natrinema versiforme JCM 10478]
MMFDTEQSDVDRGQAYTLEGFISAMVVLMAVLFALQSAVITPTTGGLSDRTVQAQIQQEAQDALLVSAVDEDKNLSYMVRYWGEDGFEGTEPPTAPNGDKTYNTSDFKSKFTLGKIMERRFAENGWSYNVHLYPQGTNNASTLVYQGSPPSSALTASYTVTLYDNQTVTASSDENLQEVENPPFESPYSNETPLYDVVEVRVVIW